MTMVDNIYLIGFSGTGKTSTGIELALILGWVFIDMDCMIENNLGKSISDIFEDVGEDVFRNAESECLRDVSEARQQVVSTGGGVPVLESNRFMMCDSGTVVCLTADIETIYANKTNNSVIKSDHDTKKLSTSTFLILLIIRFDSFSCF